jgi:hypothetical protein
MRATFVDTGNDIVEVPWADIEGIKQMADGSWRFKLVGGPYHDLVVRVYPPCDRIVFPPRNTNEGLGVVYEICPPQNKRNKWVYIHNPIGDTAPPPVTRLMIRKVEKLGAEH